MVPSLNPYELRRTACFVAAAVVTTYLALSTIHANNVPFPKPKPGPREIPVLPQKNLNEEKPFRPVFPQPQPQLRIHNDGPLA